MKKQTLKPHLFANKVLKKYYKKIKINSFFLFVQTNETKIVEKSKNKKNK